MILQSEPSIRISAINLDKVNLCDAPPLTDVEHRRANSLSARSERHRFVASRVAVRALVAEELSVDASAVTARFHCQQCGKNNMGGHGKPRYWLDDAPVPVSVSFSRCGDWMVCMLAGSSISLGVDMEDSSKRVFNGTDFETIFASQRERKYISNYPTADRVRFRAQIWARKEAVLKATGDGLRIDPSRIDTGTREQPRMDNWPAELRRFSRVQVLDVDPNSLEVPKSLVIAAATLEAGFQGWHRPTGSAGA